MQTMIRPMFLTAGLFAAFVVAAQVPVPIRVDVTLVTVDVMVSDAGGRPVTNLMREDFQIFEDGNPQEIRTFSPADSPYSILLLIDRSTSMQDYWPLMEPAIARFLTNLKPQDRISIGAFDESSKNVELLLDWRTVENGTTVLVPINPAIRGNPYSRSVAVGGPHPPNDGTRISDVRLAVSVRTPTKDFYGALDWTVQRLASVTGRKGVLVFTDGRQPGAPMKSMTFDGNRQIVLADAEDDGDFEKLLGKVQTSQARFDFVAVNTDLNPAGGRFGMYDHDGPLSFGLPVRLRLEQLAANSAGRVVFPKRVDDTLKLYEEIAHELGTSYTLGYSPAAATFRDGRYHRIEVRGLRAGVKIQQSRDGYTGR